MDAIDLRELEYRTEDPRAKEALGKRRYYAAVVTVLSDGSYAVFANDRHSESMVIVDNPDDLAIAIESRFKIKQRITSSKEQILGELNEQLHKMGRTDTDGSGGSSGRPAGSPGRRGRAPKVKTDFSDLFS